MRIHEILDPRAVLITDSPLNKEEAINQLVTLLSGTGCLGDPDRFRRAVYARERQGSTGLGGGVAIPHAKSAGVLRPGLAAMVVRNGIDFDAMDGKKTFLLFMIASPHQASDAHLDVLARLSALLVDEGFRRRLTAVREPDEFMACIDAAEKNSEPETEQPAVAEITDQPRTDDGAVDLVAVTACPAGLSHTYMAAESLEQMAHDMGLRIKVEADGAAGTRNQLLPGDIASAKAVIVAADRAVDMGRFIGKRLVRTGVVLGVQQPDVLITRALDPKCPVYKGTSRIETVAFLTRMYRHLMSGLAYIMPLVAAVGILAGLAGLDFVRGTEIGNFITSICMNLGTLLFPVLSAFIAFSIAGRTALVAGFIGGVMAEMDSAGVLCALCNGFAGGYLSLLMSKVAQRFLRGHDAMVALLVFPIVGAVGTALIAQFITSAPSAFVQQETLVLMNQAPGWQLMLLGMVLGGMMSFDMGGPCNKLAYACGVLLLADCLPQSGPGSMVMASVMAGGMVPSVAAGLAALCGGSRLFTGRERKLIWISIGKGLIFITEGVLPYLMIRPRKMRFACVVASAVAGGLSMTWHCSVCAPHGGVFIIPLAENLLWYCLALSAGTVTGIALFIILRATDHALRRSLRG